MSYKFEIELHEDDVVIFYIGNIRCYVETKTHLTESDYPVSFNSINDVITYATEDQIYYEVLPETLQFNKAHILDSHKICEKLEEQLNII
tara:strand:+ start:114 stop:383 length:270 start_codon:yes stop_codon:yes gene_type:complete